MSEQFKIIENKKMSEKNEIIKMIEQSGLSNVKKFRLTGGIVQLLVAEKPKN